MPRTALAVQQITRSGNGLVQSNGAANAAGHSVPNDGQVFLEVVTTTNACVVTIDTPGSVDGNAIANKTHSIGTATTRKLGPYPPSTYNQADNSIYVDFDLVTGVSIGAYRLT